MQASENKKIKKKKSVNTEIANTKTGRHRIWLRVISFAVVVVLLLIGAGKLCDPIRLGLQDSVSERERYLLHLLSEPEEMVDVAILGDSESYTLVSTYQLWKEARHCIVYRRNSPGNGRGKLFFAEEDSQAAVSQGFDLRDE